MPVYLLMSAFTIWMAVECVRRGQAGSWLWIILMFGPVGAAVYFFSEYQPLRWRGSGGRKVTASDLRIAEADARRLDTAAAWGHLASLQRLRRDFPKAVAAAGRAVERDPQSIEAQSELGLAQLGARQPAAAIPALRAVVERDTYFQSGDALFALAEAERSIADYAAARGHYETLIERYARSEILYALAETQAHLGDRAAASQTLHRLLEEAEFVPEYMRHSVKPWVRKARRALAQMAA
jgi:hypothetical protein